MSRAADHGEAGCTAVLTVKRRRQGVYCRIHPTHV